MLHIGTSNWPRTRRRGYPIDIGIASRLSQRCEDGAAAAVLFPFSQHGEASHMLDFITADALVALGKVIAIDLVLAGDNAIVIGLAAAGLPPQQRLRAIMIGIVAATLMRIGFAAMTTQLLEVFGLLLAGGLLLLWVCWKMWRELRSGHMVQNVSVNADGTLSAHGGGGGMMSGEPQGKTLKAAVWQIIIADISMSLDNVLAVAGAAREHPWIMAGGLILSIALMGVAATFIARLLDRYRWLAWVGLIVIVYVALSMIWEGGWEIEQAAVSLT
jgi:YjbE family integral membrane protein